MRWTPIFGRPDKVKLPGWEAPYQEQDDGREAASVWRGLQGEGGVGGRLKMEVEWLKKATEVG